MIVKLLLEQAQQCWRLAGSIYNQEIAAELEAYARQLEERASSLEQETDPAYRPDRSGFADSGSTAKGANGSRVHLNGP